MLTVVIVDVLMGLGWCSGSVRGLSLAVLVLAGLSVIGVRYDGHWLVRCVPCAGLA